MFKKIIFLLLLIGGLSAQLFSQPCTSPPFCIQDGDFTAATTLNVSNWYVSHGAPYISTANAPNASGGSIHMSSLMNAGSGVFTCYDFKQGKTYKVCFWVRNVSGWPSNPWGSLFVYAANNMVVKTSNGNVPSVSLSQIIDNSYVGPQQSGASSPSGDHPWKYISAQFTPHSNFNCLWFYPLNPMGAPPPGNAQWNLEYQVEVDDVRVSEDTSYALTISASKDTIGGCGDSTILQLNGAPAFANVSWKPSTGLNFLSSTLVVAKPCSTITYEILVTDSSALCPSCLTETLYHTVYVDQLSDSNLITAPDTVICGDTLRVSYAPNPNKPCGVTYTWRDPAGNIVGTGTSFVLPNVTTTHSGFYTLEVLTPKGCSEIQKVWIRVIGCCRSNPSFTFSGCNPVSFTNTSTGRHFLQGAFWDFGDGQTSTAINPVHNFSTTTTRPYTVCLTSLYRDSLGEACCQRKCVQVPVCPPPPVPPCVVTADFSFSIAAAGGFSVNFKDMSSGNGVICGYTWYMGDGTSFSTMLPSVSHFYTGSGPYTVCLVVQNCVYDANGNLISSCSDSICKTVSFQNPFSKTTLATVVTDIPEPAQVQVYPNPVSQLLNIQVYGIQKPRVLIKNLQGALVGEATMRDQQGFVFDTESLAAGMYLVEVLSNEHHKYVKFVKRH